MSSSREMTNEEKDILQSVLDDSYQRFINIVAEGRDMPEKKVKKLADGRIYSAQQAEKNGLIDEIGYNDNALKALKKDIKAKDAEVFKYSADEGWFSSIYSTKSTLDQFKNELSDLKSIISNDTEAEPMYLYKG